MTQPPAGSAPAFFALADHVEDVIARFDAECRYLYLNEPCAHLLGLPRAEVLGRAVDAVGTPEATAARMCDAIRRAFGGELVHLGRIASSRPSRGTMWLEARFIPERDDDGTVSAVVLCARDITAQHTAEEALRESEERFRAVFENAPVGMAFSTREADGYATNANSALARMLGYSREELARMHFSEFTHSADIATDVRLFTQVRDGLRDGYCIEKRLVRKDGSAFWAEVTLAAIRGGEGAARFIVGIVDDISERKEIEAELRESEERFRALVERASDISAIVDADGTIRYASPAQTRLLGYLPEEIRGMNALALVHPEDVGRIRDRMAEAMSVPEPIPAERPIRFRRRDGSWRAFMVVTTDLRSNPAVRGIIINARDVTEELRLQEQLTQAQKMEALGQLAGGVAHDFNNILAAISGYAELLAMELTPGTTTHDDVLEIVKAAARGAGVTKQLLAFSRRQTLETEVLDLREVLAETGRMLRALLPASIELELPEVDGAPVPVRAARAQVEQIVLNLAVNARDAMPAGGRLTIALDVRRTSAAAEAVLVVADSGEGMTPEVRNRAFEPFFTTKAKGQGTGLGLATVYGLVRQFGGRIELQSSPGAGTAFTILLPLATGEEVEQGSRRAETVAAATPARLLVAEDEPQLRTVIARGLERAGYEVVTAVDGGAALAALHAGTFDLLISDVAMPRLGGRELAVAIEAGWPGLPVVLTSGYAELGATPDAVRELPKNVVSFVAKPFEVERLVTIVEGALRKR